MKNILLKKFLSFSIGGYINVIIGLITTPIITRLISPKEYGISSLITAIVGVIAIISYIGLDQGFMRFFYEEKEENRGNFLFEILKYPIILNIIIGIIIFIFRNKISIFILGKIENKLWIIIVIYSFFMMLNRFSLLVVRMQQKAKLYSFFNVISKILDIMLFFLLYKKYGNKYIVIVLSLIGTLIISTLLEILIEKNIWCFKGKTETKKSEILKYSIPFTLTTALTWIFNSCDKIFIKLYSDLVELGLYSGAFKIIALLTVIQTGFYTFWVPTIYERYNKNPNDLIFFKKSCEWLSILFFSIGIGILLTRNILIIFLGEEYRNSIYIMPMLVFVPVMQLISIITEIGIILKKESKYFIYSSGIVSILNIIGNILLIPKFGAKGAAISTGISYILFLIIKTYFSTKLINFGFDLKRIYLVIFLMFIYAMILTFYNNIYFTILVGILLEIVVLLIYLPILKELYFKYLKKE